jgi:hypothetical protein
MLVAVALTFHPSASGELAPCDRVARAAIILRMDGFEAASTTIRGGCVADRGLRSDAGTSAGLAR